LTRLEEILYRSSQSAEVVLRRGAREKSWSGHYRGILCADSEIEIGYDAIENKERSNASHRDVQANQPRGLRANFCTRPRPTRSSVRPSSNAPPCGVRRESR
jgi:hypothetical protein